MKRFLLTRRATANRLNQTVASSVIGAGMLSLLAMPALAHHPFSGTAPKTFLEGLLSGMGHPVIGFDHLAFVVAIGLLAAVVRKGLIVPTAFVIATLAGTGLHLTGLNLPAAELVIAGSVVVFGLLAVMGERLNPLTVAGLAAVSGVFHGYAYGEAVVGAEATPLVAYLIGFAAVQGAIAFGTYRLSKRAVNKNQMAGLVSVRHAGFVVLGAGAAFLGGLLV